MSTTVSCGQCGAPLRPDQAWCALCYAQVQTGFDPLTAPIEQVLELHAIPERQPDTASQPAPTRPDTVEVNPPILEQPDFQPVSSAAVTPAEANESETNSEVTDLDVMFSMLAAEHRRGDPTQTLADRLEDKSTRIAVMVGGTMVVALLAFVALTLLGAIF